MKKSEWVIFFFFLYSLRIAFFDEFFFLRVTCLSSEEAGHLRRLTS